MCPVFLCSLFPNVGPFLAFYLTGFSQALLASLDSTFAPSVSLASLEHRLVRWTEVSSSPLSYVSF